MSPKYKLIYFDARGVAEPIRFILTYMGEDFEDHRVERSEWLDFKPTTPFGKLPVLEIDGKQYSQSMPIYRFLGKEANLAGDNDLENLEIDIIGDVINDLKTAVTIAFWEVDEEVKKTKIDAIISHSVPYNFRKLEEIAKHNNGYLANGKLSWVDFMFASIAENFNEYLNKKECLSTYPTLKSLKETVLSLPQVKEWIEKRPHTEL